MRVGDMELSCTAAPVDTAEELYSEAMEDAPVLNSVAVMGEETLVSNANVTLEDAEVANSVPMEETDVSHVVTVEDAEVASAAPMEETDVSISTTVVAEDTVVAAIVPSEDADPAIAAVKAESEAEKKCSESSTEPVEGRVDLARATTEEPVKKVFVLGPKSFETGVQMLTYFYELLHGWVSNYNVNKYEFMVLLDLVSRGHRDPPSKIGSGIKAFQVRIHPEWHSRCYYLIRTDGSEEDFSYRKCVDNLAPLPENLFSPSGDLRVERIFDRNKEKWRNGGDGKGSSYNRGRGFGGRGHHNRGGKGGGKRGNWNH